MIESYKHCFTGQTTAAKGRGDRDQVLCWDEKRDDFPGGKKFHGNPWNERNSPTKSKQSAREAAGEEKS